MRVGLVIYGNLEARSGGFLYDRKLVEHLQERGEEVTIFALPWRSYPHLLLQNFSLSWRKQLAEAPIDLLLQDELNHPSLFLINAYLRRRASYPLVSVVHHLRSDEAHPRWLLPLYRGIERRYLNSVDALVCNSQATLMSVRRLGASSKAAVVAHPGRDESPSGIDAQHIMARAQEIGPLRLLFVGNVIPRKGLSILLKALAQLPTDIWQLTVVGDLTIDPQYAQEVKQLAASLSLGERVEWLGAVGDAWLANLYAQHHVLAVPSTHEGFGIVYIEGMGYGLPALASRSGGAVEIVRDGETGFLIDPGDVGMLAERIAWLHGHRQALGEMGQRAQQRFQSHPTWEESAEQINNFLHSFVE